jgi:6-pyruvoyltetrahydropterin/6-carboxytetrahydropterin synthase
MGPIAQIVHRESFSAAHRLHSRLLGAQENRETYGPCENIHGHNYVLEVVVEGPVDPRTGMVLNLNTLMRVVREEIIDQVDHRFLNEDVPFLRDLPVITAETLAVAFWERLVPHQESWGAARLRRVRLAESDVNLVDYYGAGAGA